MLEAYSHSKHLPMLKKWLNARGITPPPTPFFSDLGLVSHNRAIGFLFTTNSAIGYFDHIAADGACTKEERSEALNALFVGLVDLAEKKGVKLTMLYSARPELIERLKDFGFKHHGEYAGVFRLGGI